MYSSINFHVVSQTACILLSQCCNSADGIGIGMHSHLCIRHRIILKEASFIFATFMCQLCLVHLAYIIPIKTDLPYI